MLLSADVGIADMSSLPDTEKDRALRMVGRTVVNFQRLEHNLKLAARLGPMHGTIQKVQSDIARRHERASTLTLGQAIQAWLEYCYGQSARRDDTPDLFDVSVQVTFTLGSDPESQARHASALSQLLEVRNDLIHSRLALFDWESHEACEELITQLEQINPSIAEQLEYTSTLLIADLYKEHAESLAAEFLKDASAVAATMPDTSL